MEDTVYIVLIIRLSKDKTKNVNERGSERYIISLFFVNKLKSEN